MKPLALIVHNRLSPAPTEDEQDVLVQAAVLAASLDRIGWRSKTLPLTLDLAGGRCAITAVAPDCIFNLVESLDGSDRFVAAAPLLYEELHLPYTGACAASLAITSDKCRAKTIMRAAGIPTPQWKKLSAGTAPDIFPCIIKSATDHSSIGISDRSVLQTPTDWEFRIAGTAVPAGTTGLFSEEYIEGREFNLSLLQQSDGEVLVLPPAEIDFSAFPAGKPRIVGYAAKWDETTFEYHNTPRIFPDDHEDTSLLQQLRSTAFACWNLFSLSGYARVDFRVDHSGSAQVLEVNANPCLSPDAGFAAACRKAGISYDTMVETIIETARAGNY